MESRGYVVSCPSCERPWDTNDAVRRVGRDYYARTIRAARRKQLVARETSRLPNDVDEARRVRMRRHLRERVRALTEQLRLAGADSIHVFAELRETQRLLRRLARHAPASGGDQSATPVVRCGHADCTGVAADPQGLCRACKRRTCLHCLSPVADGEAHECDPASLESVRAIQRECRPCVRCAAPSYRSEGCPTMWCVRCHTFWHWETGQIVESRTHLPHNPDHRAWVAGGAPPPREVGDLPCGGLPDSQMLHNALMREFMRTLAVHASNATVVNAFDSLHRAQELRVRYPRAWDEARAYEAQRIAYINGDLDEESFGAALERQERHLLYRSEVGAVLEGLVLAGTDVMQRFCEAESCTVCAQELNALRDIAIDGMQQVARVHGRAVPTLRLDWTWHLPYQRVYPEH